MGELILDPLPPFDTRNFIERRYVLNTFNRPWSGYLGGVHQGEYWVERLSDEWKSTFGCKYAIPCNSATSGLLAACMAAEIGPGDVVWAPVTTMSATASCAKVLGATIKLIDIEPVFFSMDMQRFSFPLPKAIIVTNLFGHPAKYLKELRAWCDAKKVVLIEDNAQSPLAKSDGVYAGTVGHMGVFSLNVHKHLQTGEGGVVVTNDGDLALRIKDAINHGELSEGITGLNLRMTEPTAALACAQLGKIQWIVESRRELAHQFDTMVWQCPDILQPIEQYGSHHVYYIWAAKLPVWNRDLFISRLNIRGFPMVKGYSPLLSRIFKITNDSFPVAERLEDKELITFDICSYSPKKRHLRMMRDILHKVMDSFK